MTKNVLNFFVFVHKKTLQEEKGILKDIHHVGDDKGCTLYRLYLDARDVELHAYLSFTRMK